jgi:DNA mismatch repair protein MutS
MGLYDEYVEVCQKYKAIYGDLTLVLFEVGSFLEWYNCDANLGVDVRRVCDLLNVNASRKNKSVPNVSRSNPMFSGIPRHALPKYLPLLLEADYTVVLVTQTTPPPNVERRVTEVLSRTTAVASYGGGRAGDEANNLMAIFASSNTAGWAVIDLTTGRSSARECTDTRSLPLDELHRAVAVADPREVVVLLGDERVDVDELRAHVGLHGRRVHTRVGGAVEVRPAYQETLLRKVFPDTGFLTPAEFLDLERAPHALTAFVAVLCFAYEHNETIVDRVCRPVTDGETVMSYNALRQLGVLEEPDRQQCLLRLLNCCKTAIGRRAFRTRLLNPTVDADTLCRRYDAIEAAATRFEQARRHLTSVGDVERAFRRACMGCLSPCDLPTLVASLEAAAEALRCMDDQRHGSASAVAAFVCATIDLESAGRCSLDDIRGNVFLPGVHEDIDAAHAELQQEIAVFYEAAAALNLRAGAEHVRVDSNEADGLWLTVTAKRWRALSDISKPQFRGEPFDLPPSSLRLTHSDLGEKRNDRVRGMQRRLGAMVRQRYVAYLRGPLADRGSDFASVIAGIEDADVTAACAYNATTMRHCRPTLANASGDKEARSWVRAKGLRHALAERLSTSTAYVPNDISLGCDKVGGMLLYGVNAVGKSSAMKAVGIAVLMAQAGMFVACTSCELCPFARVFTRVGMQDDICRGHSTFMVEMLELRSILRHADQHSLVIGDELCAGTEAASALSIVGAGIVCLIQKRAAFVFATHLHELTDLAQVRDLPELKVFHLSVRCEDNGRLVFDRKLTPGKGLATYGLEVCKSMSMDPEFMRAADDIRRDVLGIPKHIVNPQKSRYNAAVYVDACGVCNKPADQTHHVRFQAEADDTGFVEHFHKHSQHNLVPLCDSCHERVHHGQLQIHGYEKTSDGVRLRWNT